MRYHTYFASKIVRMNYVWFVLNCAVTFLKLCMLLSELWHIVLSCKSELETCEHPILLNLFQIVQQCSKYQKARQKSIKNFTGCFMQLVKIKKKNKKNYGYPITFTLKVGGCECFMLTSPNMNSEFNRKANFSINSTSRVNKSSLP